MLKAWKSYACDKPMFLGPGNTRPVNGLGVESLEAAMPLCSTDMVLLLWRRCACHRMWCSQSESVLPVNGFQL